MIEFFQKGGPVMWALLALAIIALSIILERFITLYILAWTNPLKLVQKVIEIIEEQGLKEALDYLYNHRSPVAKVLVAGLEKVQQGKSAFEDAMIRKATSELAFLDRGMIYLSAITTIAPLIGFIGTAIGLMKAFNTVAISGEVEPALVAGGISEALIATTASFIIAAPSALFYAIFTSRINTYQRQIEEASNALVEYLLEKGILVI
ncbi:MAG: MotA/TolQ/ExbB proton channel family protein [candidate division WOR-3 bacterium]|jgi:biopolymer transport protein ExbB